MLPDGIRDRFRVIPRYREVGTMRASYRGGESVHLRKLLKQVHRVIDCSSDGEVLANSCCCDPEKVREGDVFFVIDWKNCGCPNSPFAFDGCDDFNRVYEPDHVGDVIPRAACSLEETVALAQRRGCQAIVAEHPIAGVTVPLFIVPNAKESFGALCHAIFGNPARSLQVVGITGTSGKTSTSYLIAGMLAEAGSPVGLIGSLGIYDGETLYPTRETTPPANELAFWLFRMVANGCTHVLLEVSSRAIAQARLAGIKLDAVCVTNIKRDHLDYHETVEKYRRTKLGIFRYARKKGIVVCNADDRITSAVLPLIDHPALTVGIRGEAEVSGVVVERARSEQTFLLTAGTEAVPMRTRIIGDEHIYNCLMATALGVGWEIDLKTIVRGLERVESIPSRLERIECGQPFGVFIDCAQTPDALGATLRTLRGVTEGRLICVFGATGTQEPARRVQLGRTIDTLADIAVVTTDEMFNRQSILAMHEIADGFTSETGAPLTLQDRAEAIAWSLAEAREGDCVLIVGKGLPEQAPASPDVLPPFCDRVFVKQWLYENQPVAA